MSGDGASTNDITAQCGATAHRFTVKPRSIGFKPGLTYDSISALLELDEELDDDSL